MDENDKFPQMLLWILPRKENYCGKEKKNLLYLGKRSKQGGSYCLREDVYVKKN